MILSNCHTHTNYCDGKATAEQMILSAIDKGFSSIGISSHSPMSGGCDWTMKKEKVNSYIEEINALKEKYKDSIQVYCGIELDNYFTDIDIDKFDYAIGSVHQYRSNEKIYDVDYTAQMLQELTDENFNGNWNKMAEWYFEAVADFVIENDVDVVGHFDLITKFNERYDLFSINDTEYKNAALKSIDRILEAKSDIIFEINTGAMSRYGNKFPYPSVFIIEHLHKRNARITITGDSHNTETIDFGYNTAIELCKECGYTKSYILYNGSFTEIEL